VVQVVSSPLRNAVPRNVQRGFRFAASRPASLIGRALARSAGLRPPEVQWQLTAGPLVGNGLGSLRLDRRSAELALEGARLDGQDPVLVPVHAERLDLADGARPASHVR
jgi:hypothetical protein